MHCKVGVRTIEVAGVARTPMRWILTSVEEQLIGQDHVELATERPGGRDADLLL